MFGEREIAHMLETAMRKNAAIDRGSAAQADTSEPDQGRDVAAPDDPALLSYRDAQRACRARGLRAVGSLAVLRARLVGDGLDRTDDDLESQSGGQFELQALGDALVQEGRGGTAAATAELEAARASALEAVALRTQPSKSGRQVAERRAVPKTTNPRLVPCRYSAMTCEGCGEGFAFGEMITAGLRAMVHPRAECRELARLHLYSMQPAARARQAPTTEATIQQARMLEKTSDARIVSAQRCITGQCGVVDEQRLMCMRSCGRGVHVTSCLGESCHYKAAGRLICQWCRAADMLGSGRAEDTPASLIRTAIKTMCLELTTGAVSTAAGRNQFTVLEREWQQSVISSGGGSPAEVRLPRNCMESFIAFMWWLVTDADRARSYATTLRAAGALMSMHELDDWTKHSRVKAISREIEKMCCVEHTPCTQTTKRIVGIMVDKTITTVCGIGRSAALNRVLAARTFALLALELLGGIRVGEATSSGDLHGVVANDTSFFTPLDSSVDDGLGETVEAIIRDSKTGPSRHIAFVAITRTSHLQGGRWMRQWIQASCVEMTITHEAGLRVERPDYWVVRVSVAAMSKAELEKFMVRVTNSLCGAGGDRGQGDMFLRQVKGKVKGPPERDALRQHSRRDTAQRGCGRDLGMAEPPAARRASGDRPWTAYPGDHGTLAHAHAIGHWEHLHPPCRRDQGGLPHLGWNERAGQGPRFAGS